MSQIFTRKMKDELIHKIQTYLLTELDQKVGNFEAEFLLVIIRLYRTVNQTFPGFIFPAAGAYM